jgi:hypothetical protein
MHDYHHLIKKMSKRKKVVIKMIPQRLCETNKFEKERKEIDETH